MGNNFENLPAGTVVEIKGGYLVVIISLFPLSHDIYSDVSRLNSNSGYDYGVETYPFSNMNMDTPVAKVYKNYPKFKNYISGIMFKDIQRVVFMGYKDETFDKLMK